MPGGDGTGPQGLGPATGWGRGGCVPNAGFRAGSRGNCGRGMGRGWRNQFYATGVPGWARGGFGFQGTLTGEQKKEMLKGQSEFLKAQLQDIQSELNTLEKK